MSNLKQSFGKRLRYFRLQRGLTQEQLAELSSLSVDFLSLVERGVNAPSFESLERLCDALQVEPKALFEF